MNLKSHSSQLEPKSSTGFTLTELIMALAALAILALTILPALARTQPNMKAAQCRHNLKQLITAWQMYPEEHSGIIVPNYHGSYSPQPALSWAAGWLDWGSNPDNTNFLYLIDVRYALLAPYLNGASNLFKCPADQYLSSQQRLRGWTQRVRSYSANIYIGEGNATQGPTDPIYKQVRKISEFLYPTPAEAWTYVDEHPDSLNDPAFFSPNQTSWIDIPATYHDGGVVLAFSDGHTEDHKWRGSLAKGRAARVSRVDYINTGIIAPAGDPDIGWMSYHTPRVSSQSY